MTVCDAMLLGIFAHSEPGTLVEVRETCQRWRRVGEDWSLWREVVLPGAPSTLLTEERLKEILRIGGSEIHALTIPAAYLDSSSDTTQKTFSLLQRQCKDLTSLSVVHGLAAMPPENRSYCHYEPLVRVGATMPILPDSLKRISVTLYYPCDRCQVVLDWYHVEE